MRLSIPTLCKFRIRRKSLFHSLLRCLCRRAIAIQESNSVLKCASTTKRQVHRPHPILGLNAFRSRSRDSSLPFIGPKPWLNEFVGLSMENWDFEPGNCAVAFTPYSVCCWARYYLEEPVSYADSGPRKVDLRAIVGFEFYVCSKVAFRNLMSFH